MSNDDSTINFMSGSPLNRLGWLRSSPKFINRSALSPRTKWLLFRSGNPLIDTRSGSPIEVPIQRIQPLLGPLPYFGQGRLDGEEANEDVKALESARLRGPKAVFLGVWERERERERDADGVTMEEIAEGVKGDAYFALDVSDVEGSLLEDVQAQLGTTGVQADYVSARTAASRYDRQQGAIFAAAKSLLEWNSRIKVSCFSKLNGEGILMINGRSFALDVDLLCILYGLVGNCRALLCFLGRNLVILHVLLCQYIACSDLDVTEVK